MRLLTVQSGLSHIRLPSPSSLDTPLAARLLRNCRLLDVPLQIMKMPPAAGRAFKSLNLSNLITILKK
jgi:hypothetical protein